jgi:alpha/beta superfamily hydrolase
MGNPVVVGVARALAQAGLAALRFDFGGVGGSEGAYGQGREEQCDVGAAVTALAGHLPAGAAVVIVGYSFGAWVGMLAAQGLPCVSRVVAIGPPLALFDFGPTPGLRQPIDVVVGDRDQYCPTVALERFVAAHGARVTMLPGVDHFLGGVESQVAAAVVRCLEQT